LKFLISILSILTVVLTIVRPPFRIVMVRIQWNNISMAQTRRKVNLNSKIGIKNTEYRF
jgi:hypothetical protein